MNVHGLRDVQNRPGNNDSRNGLSVRRSEGHNPGMFDGLDPLTVDNLK